MITIFNFSNKNYYKELYYQYFHVSKLSFIKKVTSITENSSIIMSNKYKIFENMYFNNKLWQIYSHWCIVGFYLNIFLEGIIVSAFKNNLK